MPLTVGVPLIVTVLFDHEPLTPVGNPVTVAPVAPVLASAIVVMALLIHVVRLTPTAIVFNGRTVIVLVMEAGGHPPIIVIV